MKGYRLIVMIALTVILFLVLIIRFYSLQIVNYTQYRSEAVGNMLNRIDIAAPRGIVYDRAGDKLIYNVPCYNIVVFPDIIKQHPRTWEKLSQITGVSVEKLQKEMKRNQYGSYRPAIVLRNIDRRTNAIINESIRELPGAELSFDPIREYSDKILSGNLLGYTAEIRSRDLYKYRDEGYKLGDIIGYDGIEKQYEHFLRGIKGYRYKQVNATGKPLSDKAYEQTNPIPGNALYLTIDQELQTYAESLLVDYNGAAIMMNYENGEIITSVTAPSYDPEMFARGLTQTQWDSIVQDKRIPLFNRTIRGQYPPGSIYKMIAAIAGLEKEIVDPNVEYECTGVYDLGGREFKCAHVHGMENLDDAIAHSCNIYFYNLILELGIDDWSAFAKDMTMGQKTNVDLPGELAGICPDRAFLDKRYGRRKWWQGTWLNMVIGQGDVLMTPMQAVRYTGILATRGKIVQPHFLKSVHKANGGIIEKIEYPVSYTRDIAESTWDQVELGMYNAVQSSWGTGITANVPGLRMHGKTGTAQNPHGEPHAWFIGYSKLKDFPYAVVVFLEHGLAGSDVAAPMAGKLLKAYYYMREE